ncbi:MAG TPA: MBL fold metallo-hydrolase [Candidatus Dormibacteraeota bacterium]|nr:MBL fold metallo-hydrolase [Candidatus Dormibacteraeota bacterium]
MDIEMKPERHDSPEAMTGVVNVLVIGSVDPSSGTVESTVSLVRDGAATIIIDPGMVYDRRQILEPLETLAVDPDDVTDIVFSHHHPDHTLNAALFRNARVHDHWATYYRNSFARRTAEGTLITPSVRLIATPGHSPQDITTLVGTADGVYAFTHVWWHEAGPPLDPLADMDELHLSRARVLRVANRVIPGHGNAFTPGTDTPR